MISYVTELSDSNGMCCVAVNLACLVERRHGYVENTTKHQQKRFKIAHLVSFGLSNFLSDHIIVVLYHIVHQ